MKIKGAIFDMDGTLVDSMKYWETVGIEYLKKNNIDFNNERDNYILQVGIKQFSDFCNKEYGLNKTYKEVLQDIHDLMAEKYKTVVTLKAGAKEMLEKFKQNGVKMCIATATEQKEAKEVLKKLDILDYFDEVITTTMVGADKTSPLIYETALNFLGTSKEETYIFEDAFYAIHTLHKAGFKIVGIEEIYSSVPSSEIAPLCTYFLWGKDEYNISFFE